MRTVSARVSPLVLLTSGPVAAQNQPPSPPAPTPAAAAPAPATAGSAPAVAAAAPAWQPFQELAFLVGSWSGSAESGARVGGRVARFTPEFTGNYLVHRGSTILTADVEIAPEGLRLASRELLNTEAGTKARMFFSRKSDGELTLSMDLAPAGKEFVPFLTSSLRKK